MWSSVPGVVLGYVEPGIWCSTWVCGARYLVQYLGMWSQVLSVVLGIKCSNKSRIVNSIVKISVTEFTGYGNL